MNLNTLKYYINKEKSSIERIFLNLKDWSNLIKQLDDPVIHINNWIMLDGIYIHKNVHQPVNWANFVICFGDPKEATSYSNYDIEILTEDEKLIRDIIE